VIAARRSQGLGMEAVRFYAAGVFTPLIAFHVPQISCLVGVDA
jgi:hypothetical protein